MVSVTQPLKLIAGIVLAMPPRFGNLAHELIDVLVVTAHSSFEVFSEFLKIAIIVYGYFLIVISFLQTEKTQGHKVRRFSKNPKY